MGNGYGAEPDSYFPTDALLYGPNGDVIFYGKVKARGVDLDVAPNNNYPPPVDDFRIAAKRADGTLVSSMLTYEDTLGIGTNLEIRCQSNRPTNSIATLAQAAGRTVGIQSVAQGGTDSGAQVNAIAAGVLKNLIRGDGVSDFAFSDLSNAASNGVTGFAPLQGTGGADVTGTFTLPWPAQCYGIHGGTGYCTGTVTAYLDNYLDGNYRGSTPFFFNQAGVHLFTGIHLDFFTLGAGGHSVRMAPGGNLSRDFNDYSTYMIIAVRNG